MGVPQKALRGKGLGAPPGAQGWRSSRSSRPRDWDPGNITSPRPNRHSILSVLVLSAASGRPNGTDQAGAGAQAPGGGPQQPRPGDAREAGSRGGRLGPRGAAAGRAHGDWCPALRRQPMGGKGAPGAGRKRSLRLCDAPPSRCCAVDDACPGRRSEAQPGIRASGGAAAGAGTGVSWPAAGGAADAGGCSPGSGVRGWGNGLRGRAGPRPGGRLRLCGRFTWRAAGTAGQRQRTGAQPRRAGTRRIPAGSGGRAKEAGGLETLRMWHLRLPGQAEPGGHLALGPPGPQPPSALAARLRVWEKVLGAGAWGGGSGHRGHLGDPGFPRSTRRLYSGCGGAAQLTGGFRNGVEGPDGERPLKRVRILLGSVWALPPTCLSLPRPQHLFSLQSVQIKNYRSRALSIVTCRLIGWCQGIGANRVFSTKTSSLGVFASISKFWLKLVGHSFSGTCGLHLL